MQELSDYIKEIIRCSFHVFFLQKKKKYIKYFGKLPVLIAYFKFRMYSSLITCQWMPKFVFVDCNVNYRKTNRTKM